MPRQYRLRLEPGADGGERLLLLRTVGGGVSVPVAQTNLNRPARRGALHPNFLLGSALVMFGDFVHGDLTVEFAASERLMAIMSQLWRFDIRQADQIRRWAVDPLDADEHHRALTVSDDFDAIGREAEGCSSLVILPQDRFNGRLATMYSLTIATNAASEAARLYGADRYGLGLLSIAIAYAPTVKASSIIIDRRIISDMRLSEQRLSTLAALQLEVTSA